MSANISTEDPGPGSIAGGISSATPEPGPPPPRKQIVFAMTVTAEAGQVEDILRLGPLDHVVVSQSEHIAGCWQKVSDIDGVLTMRAVAADGPRRSAITIEKPARQIAAIEAIHGNT